MVEISKDLLGATCLHQHQTFLDFTNKKYRIEVDANSIERTVTIKFCTFRKVETS